MIPQTLTLHNFLSYKGPVTLDFSRFDLACLSGPNGVGKSSLLEAISWSIWGKTRAGSTDDDLVHHGEAGMFVELIFHHEGRTYRIVRRRDRRGRGKSDLTFEVKNNQAWQNIGEPTKEATQERIESSLRLPYQIFENSCYLRQGRADSFAQLKPRERKEVLAQILSLEMFDRLVLEARRRASEASARSEELSIRIGELEEFLKREEQLGKSLRESEEMVSRLASTLAQEEEKLKTLQKEVIELRKLEERVNILAANLAKLTLEGKQLKGDLERAYEERRKLEASLGREQEIASKVEELTKLRTLEADLARRAQNTREHEQTLAVINHAREQLEKTLANISQYSECPTCHRPLGADDLSKIRVHLEDEFKERYQAKWDEVRIALAEIGYDRDKHAAVAEKIASLSPFEEEYRSLREALAVRDEKERLIESLESQVTEKRRQYASLKQKLGQIQQTVNSKKSLLDEEHSLQKSIEEQRKKLLAARESLGSLRAQVEEVNRRKEEKRVRETELSSLREESQLYASLADIFGKRGIQAWIIEQIVPEIEAEGNALLERISAGRMTLELRTQREKKTAEGVIETLDIAVRDELGSRRYELYSGGEAFRINLALRVALAKILARRAGAKVEFLAIDEGFGVLDQVGKDAVVSAINSLREDFKKILVISHLEEIKNSFPTQIIVSKDRNGSNLQVVSS